jgi:hypothetical protein
LAAFRTRFAMIFYSSSAFHSTDLDRGRVELSSLCFGLVL